MTTTSTNFALTLATTSDTVSVVTQISNNFSTLDSLFGVSHTGTGQLKNSLSLTSPTLVNPIVQGTLTFTSGNIVATTGDFQTITATGGALTINSFSVGTYGYPATVGSTGQILTVTTSNAVWASNSAATPALSNLASVVINTNLNTFTAGFVTLARVIATSGALTGLTVFQATTGTFAGAITVTGNASITGTMTANTITATGGALTINSFTLGTQGFPSAIGTTSEVLQVSGSTATWGKAPYIGRLLFSAGMMKNETGSPNVHLTTGFATTAAAAQFISWVPPAGEITATVNSLIYTTRLYKHSSINTVQVWGLVWCPVIESNLAILSYTASAVTGICSGVVTTANAVWINTNWDISALANETAHQVNFYLYQTAAGGTARVACGNIVGIAL